MEPQPLPIRGEDFALSPAEPGGLLIHFRGMRLGRLNYGFQNATTKRPMPLQLEEAQAAPGDSSAFRATVAAKGQAPALELSGTVQTVDGPGLQLSYQVERAATKAQAISGGFEFDLDVQQALPALHAEKVRLRKDQRGFTVEFARGVELQIVLSESATLKVEEKNALSLQAELPATAFSRRNHPLQLRVVLPKGGKLRPDFGQRLGGAPAGYSASPLRGEGSPVDLTFLNTADRPAGKHGPVEVAGDALRFADGTSARFWGVNVVANALFRTPHAEVERTARRLAAFGFNLVRIHHHDSDWVNPNVFVDHAPDTQTLNGAALAELDYWIHCLRNEGLYVWLDLEVGRVLRKGDQVPGFDELGSQEHRVKAANFVNPRIEALMQSFAAAYLDHQNPHTGLRYREDPALAAVLVSNENDLVKHGLGLTQAEHYPYHNQRFVKLAKAFAKAQRLPDKEVLQPWAGGPGALLMGALEQSFNERALRHLRGLGLRAPVAVGNYWGWNSFDALPSLAVGDLIDVHSYGAEGELSQDPRYAANFVQWMGGAALVGKPVTVTEWNTPIPTRDRQSHPLFVAGHAALQGWDALMIYAYNQGVGFKWADPWSVGNDPALMATMPHAALILRRGDVAPARRRYVLELSHRDLYTPGKRLRPIDLRALRTLLPQSRVEVRLPDVPALDYHPPEASSDAERVSNLQRSFIDPTADTVTSDTGELTWRLGSSPQYRIDSERTQALTGFIGGRREALSVLQVELEDPYGTVAVSSLDDAPLSKSRHILLSIVGQAPVNPDPKRKPSDVFLVQPLRGRIGLRSSHRTLTLSPLTAEGKTGPAVQSVRQGDVHWFDLPEPPTTLHYLLRP